MPSKSRFYNCTFLFCSCITLAKGMGLPPAIRRPVRPSKDDEYSFTSPLGSLITASSQDISMSLPLSCSRPVAPMAAAIPESKSRQDGCLDSYQFVASGKLISDKRFKSLQINYIFFRSAMPGRKWVKIKYSCFQNSVKLVVSQLSCSLGLLLSVAILSS